MSRYENEERYRKFRQAVNDYNETERAGRFALWSIVFIGVIVSYLLDKKFGLGIWKCVGIVVGISVILYLGYLKFTVIVSVILSFLMSTIVYLGIEYIYKQPNQMWHYVLTALSFLFSMCAYLRGIVSNYVNR